LGVTGRLSVQEFAKRLSRFFATRWAASDMPANMGEQNDMVFLVGGYDEDDAYGTVFQFSIPTRLNQRSRFLKTNSVRYGAAREK